MNQLIPAERFQRALYRLSVNLWLRAQIQTALHQMTVDLAAPQLKTHHLRAPLSGLYASLAGDDCWIVFSKQKHPKSGGNYLILLNIGSSEEVF